MKPVPTEDFARWWAMQQRMAAQRQEYVRLVTTIALVVWVLEQRPKRAAAASEWMRLVAARARRWEQPEQQHYVGAPKRTFAPVPATPPQPVCAWCGSLCCANPEECGKRARLAIQMQHRALAADRQAELEALEQSPQVQRGREWLMRELHYDADWVAAMPPERLLREVRLNGGRWAANRDRTSGTWHFQAMYVLDPEERTMFYGYEHAGRVD